MLRPVRRRDLLKIAGAGTLIAATPRRAHSIPGRLREVADAAMAAARAGGASYADIRFVRTRAERLGTRDGHLTSASMSESFGAGVRVLVKGTWGFAGTQDVTVAGAKAAASTAAEIARANGRLRKVPVSLAPVTPVKDTWQTPASKDPFRVPLSRKLEILFDVDERARAGSAPIAAVRGWLHSISEEKLFVSSEGAQIDQTLVRVNPGYSVTVAANGDFESRNHAIAPMGHGFEYVEAAHLADDAARVADEAHQKLLAPPVEPGDKDLVLLPSHLWLTIHESIGHSTELDRAFGYEANFAGTSFATFPQTGTLRYAGDHVNFYGDRTTPGALATCGWDDDGVPTERWDIVKNGVLVDWQTTREQASWIGAAKGHGCSYADSWASVPFQRMPNVSLAAGTLPTTVEELVGGVQDGVLIEGTGSYSIDQQRLNFQFGGDMAWEIKAGKKGRPVRHAAYQSTSTSFWNALDALGGPATWELGGSMYDGKGEPMQVNPVSHGCPASRFRRVRVLDSRGSS